MVMNTRYLIFFTVLIVFFGLILLYFCNCCKNCIPPPPKEIKNKIPYKGYNLLLSKGINVKTLIENINTKLGTAINENHVRKCPCNENFINIDYPGLEFSGHGPLVVKTREGQEGEFPMDGDFMVNKNFIFSSDTTIVNDSVRGRYFDKNQRTDTTIIATLKNADFNKNKSPEKRVRLAIFDSGIDTTLIASEYVGVKPNPSECLPDSVKNLLIIKGLNFAPRDEDPAFFHDNSISDITDRHPNQHGTRVAYLATEQFRNNTEKGVQLLIMKVLNDANKGDGYGIICAMQHAKKLGAKIFNMSLGYYGPEDKIFKHYVDVLSMPGEDRVWLVAAAGNAMEQFDIHKGSNDAAIDRDLEQRSDTSKFYPAYFSKQMDHVIAVTTVRDDLTEACGGQNYSKLSVDFGVRADNCKFKIVDYDPVNANGRQGTSYATPVISGWLGANYDLNATKSVIAGSIVTQPDLTNFIRLGKYVIYQ